MYCLSLVVTHTVPRVVFTGERVLLVNSCYNHYKAYHICNGLGKLSYRLKYCTDAVWGFSDIVSRCIVCYIPPQSANSLELLQHLYLLHLRWTTIDKV